MYEKLNDKDLKQYAFHYRFYDKSLALTISARSPEEAKEKVKAISQAIYDGEIHHSIYIPIKEKSWIARLITRLIQK